MNILILDDRLKNNASEATALVRVLVQRGHDVRTARTVREARLALAKPWPQGGLDIAVIDLQLAPPDVPHVTGAAFAREIRADKTHDKAVVIIYTINETPGAVVEKNQKGPVWGLWHLRQDTEATHAADFIESKKTEWRGRMPAELMPDDLVSSGG